MFLVTIELGTDLIPVQNRNKCRLTERKHTFQYVPVLDGLRSLLSKKEILEVSRTRECFISLKSVLGIIGTYPQ